jgi:hypothetical protein
MIQIEAHSHINENNSNKKRKKNEILDEYMTIYLQGQTIEKNCKVHAASDASTR